MLSETAECNAKHPEKNVDYLPRSDKSTHPRIFPFSWVLIPRYFFDPLLNTKKLSVKAR